MKILVTGAKGFIGQNLIARLENLKDEPNKPESLHIEEIFAYDVDSNPTDLLAMTSKCDFVFHLAGVNRPEQPEDFMKGNFGFTSELLNALDSQGNHCPVMISSSIQAAQQNDYGKSKRAGEDLMFEYGKKTGAKVMVYRFANVFGKWSRPNYNSAVATFCYNIARGLPITVNDPDVKLSLVYIDDLVEEMVFALLGQENRVESFCTVPTEHTVRLGTIAELLYSFAKTREDLSIPDQTDAFTRKLYATYLSFLPAGGLSYSLNMNIDGRGSFTELMRTPDRGQVSINVTKPGITKGNHWHHTKNEKFIVVSGAGVIKLRHLLTNEVAEYEVTGERLDVVEIPPGYTHQITNTGTSDLVTVMWVNEPYEPGKPDTYFLEV